MGLSGYDKWKLDNPESEIKAKCNVCEEALYDGDYVFKRKEEETHYCSYECANEENGVEEIIL